MNLFDLSVKRNIVNEQVILNKAEKAKATISPMTKQKAKAPNILQTINQVYENVSKYLGDKKDLYKLITSEEELSIYIDDCIKNGEYAIDTETTGLNYFVDKVVGFSLYTPGNLAVYIPVLHKSYITKAPLDNQVSVEACAKQLQRLVDAEAKSIFFNAKFDIRMIQHSFGVKIHPYFDGMIAARLLNENEPANGLKQLHKKYILRGQEDAFTFSELFSGIQFDLIPPNVGYLYAARDAEITYQLYEFQNKYLSPGHKEYEIREMKQLSHLFWNIEMPCVEVLADMEDTGVLIDTEMAKVLHDRYVPNIMACEAQFNELLIQYDIQKHYDISSPKQLGELFYDVLRLPDPNPSKPRQTNSATLDQLEHPIVEAVKSYRALATLVNTFVLKLPNAVESDGKIHCSYAQIGADTGRLACHDPNMQNIPSRAADIRQIFRASTEYQRIDCNPDNSILIPIICNIKSLTGWKSVSELNQGDSIYIRDDNNKEMVVNVTSISYPNANTVCVNWQ